MAIFNYIKQEQYDELITALKAAFEELRNDNKNIKEDYDNKIKNINDSMLALSKQKEEQDIIISHNQAQNKEMKQLLLQMGALIDNIIRERDNPKKEVSMGKYENIQTEKLTPEEIKPTAAPGIDPNYIQGYLGDGTPILNINEIPMNMNPEQDIMKETESYKNKLIEEAKGRKKYVELYPEAAEDSARCTTCKKWIQVENPVYGETAKTHEKMIEGRCPICKNYVVKIY